MSPNSNPNGWMHVDIAPQPSFHPMETQEQANARWRTEVQERQIGVAVSKGMPVGMAMDLVGQYSSSSSMVSVENQMAEDIRKLNQDQQSRNKELQDAQNAQLLKEELLKEEALKEMLRAQQLSELRARQDNAWRALSPSDQNKYSPEQALAMKEDAERRALLRGVVAPVKLAASLTANAAIALSPVVAALPGSVIAAAGVIGYMGKESVSGFRACKAAASAGIEVVAERARKTFGPV